MHDQPELSVAGADGVTLSGEHAGSGRPVLVVHGLTATRRYVLHGSRALERSGHHVISYDARGHGRSTPPEDPRAYRYEQLVADLQAVLDAAGVQRALLAGVSMGAHTIVRFALEHPERVAALAIIMPAYDPSLPRGEVNLSGWDALAVGLRDGGVEGFVDAYEELGRLPEALRPTVETVLRQRIGAHEHPDAVANALEVVPRARPFRELDQLAQIAVPTAIIGSRDEVDPRHPLIVARHYAETIPGAQLLVEDEGHSPLAWQGGRVSSVIAELAERAQFDM
jgi:pimeloyl-ACP methyl ester carboxylesterase